MKRRKKSFLSDSLRTQIKKLYGHLKAFLFLFVAYGLWFTLFKYSPNDRSFNVVGADSIKHPLGWFGSYSADIIHQIYGKLSYLLPIFFIGFAINLWINKKINFLFRLFVFLVGISMLSFSMSYWFYPSSGSLGYIVFRDVTFHFTKITMLLIVCLTGILSVLLTFYGSCIPLSYESFHTLFKVIHSGIVKAFYYAWGAYKFGLPFIKKSISNLYKTLVLRKKELPQTEEAHLHNPFTKDMAGKRFHKDLDTQKTQAQQLDLPYPCEEESASEEQETQADNSFGHFKEWIKQKEKKPKEQHSPIKRVETGDSYTLPSVELLTNQKHKPQIVIDQSTLEAAAAQLEEVLSEFGVKGEIVNIRPGPVVTMYELKPAPGIKSARVIGLAEDIARSMCALSARIAVIPGRNVIGIELPNPKRETVYMREMLESSVFEKQQGKINIILGKDIGGAPIVADLAKMPHLLVAGTTGSGKSVAINAMILSILYKFSPDVCKFIMIDPKMLELSVYDDIPHLLTPVVTDPKKAVVALKWAVKEMENRYRAMSKLGVRNIEGYNERLKEAKESGEILTRRVQTGFDPDSGKPLFETQSLDLEPLPFIVVIVDEMADLMLVAGKDIEAAVQRLAQMARAAGIHLIMATQRPSVDVITGTIKANFPTRVSFMVTSKIDSRTILGEQGAEQLLGQGDMLYMAGGGRIQRVHGPFVNDQEVDRIVSHLKSQAEPSYIESIIEEDEEASSGSGDGEESGGDQLYNQALEVILREGKASTSFVQRHLQIGYNRAARIIEQMEKSGVISAANHAGKREVIGR